MFKVVHKISRQIDLLRQMGLGSFVTYRLARRGSQVRITLTGQELTIRKGTTDLKVAMECLSGEFDIIRGHLQPDFAGVIVDAGGYIGASGMALKALFPKAKLVIVEPSDDNIRILRENLGNGPDIRIIHGALVGGAERSIKLFNRSSREWGFSTIPDHDGDVEQAFLGEVPAFRLSDLLEDGERIGLLKLDIEGAELDLFLNDSATLETIPVVFVELHDRIVPGCSEKFREFSRNRKVIKGDGEKYLSLAQ